MLIKYMRHLVARLLVTFRTWAIEYAKTGLSGVVLPAKGYLTDCACAKGVFIYKSSQIRLQKVLWSELCCLMLGLIDNIDYSLDSCSAFYQIEILKGK